MEKDRIEINWKHIRSQTTPWWNLLNDNDLRKVEKAPGKHDNHFTSPRGQVDYSSNLGKKEISKRLARIESDQNTRVKPA